MDHLALLTVVAAFLTLAASGVAVYVSLRVKGDLAQFRIEFMRELDERYVRSREHNRMDERIAVEEKQYRADTKEKIEGVEVHIFKVKDDVNIVLKDILAAIKGRDERR